jgi:hypothetical protein
MHLATTLWYRTKPVRVIQVKKCPIVIANVAKRNEAIAWSPSPCDCFVVPPRNDRFWIIYLLEHSYSISPDF